MFHKHNLHLAPSLISLKVELLSHLKMRAGVGWRGSDREGWQRRSIAGHWGADMACLKKRLSIQNKTQRETTATRRLAAH